MANIIITGCSRGIGKEIIDLMANDKQNKVLGISRTPLTNNRDNVVYLAFDLKHIHQQADQLFAHVSKHFDSIDILINNAGILLNNSFESTPFDDAYNMVYLNYLAPAWLIRTLLPLMQRSSHAHIVNISSMGGFQGSSKYKGLAWYSSSKAALASLTECLAVEFELHNIAVNCLALGAVNTEMLQKAFPGYRAPIEPEQMAQFIVNFALTAHHVMNGKIIPVALSNP